MREKMTKVKCWEVFACGKKDCPVYHSEEPKCWLISGTHCREIIQGTFIEKMEACIGCKVFKMNIDIPSMQEAIKVIDKQFKDFRKIVRERDNELEKLSTELALSLSEVFEALKKISTGDPSVRISEGSKEELIKKLKHLVNMTAANIGEIVDQSHEIAIGLAEHFDVLHRVSKGDLGARVSGSSNIELLESLKKVTNEMIESISGEISERKETEDTLRKLEALESSILSAIPHAVLGLQNRIIIFANDAVEAVFGWKPGELIGKNTRVLYRDDKEFEEIGRLLYPALEMQQTHSEEFPCRHKDGRDILCKMSASVIGTRLKEKEIVVMYEDITAHKKIEKKLLRAAEEWRATFDSMPYGVILLDADLNILRANDYISRLYGFSYQDIVAKKCDELIYAGEEPIEGCRLIRASEINSAETFEYYVSRLNKYFMGLIRPIFDGDGSQKTFVLSLVDITEIKKKENELTKSRKAFFNMLKDLDVSYGELKELYHGLIHSFVTAIDAKSPWTKGHSERVTNYAVAIAREMGLKEREIENLKIAALLHDIGKIGTYDVILEKPEELTDEEYNLIKMHPVKGEEILRPLKQLQHLLPIIRHHHERMDGKGYPDGLKGEEIPFLARIITVADSFDSMVSSRPYRPAPLREYAISEIKKCSGTQFDPVAAAAFLKVLDRIQDLSEFALISNQ